MPIVWNSGGYEKKEMIKQVSSFVDIFLPDLKYFSSSLSRKYSQASDYFVYASQSILEMRKQKTDIFEGEVMKQGLLVRHLVLPNHYKDSFKVLEFLSQLGKVKLSLMCQFTPTKFSSIKRTLYPLEYKLVLKYAQKLGLTEGYMQDMSSSSEAFIPNFNE